MAHFKGVLKDVDVGGDLQRLSGQEGTPANCAWTSAKPPHKITLLHIVII